ncbi:hypothetical protein Fmac_027701 [Flemingia macrophylla]|uniref:Uncharacterized protein n=1 Tax=Flemingia macrophylla TaxID=520843 RepID=A0ABD1LIG4_9FABA
MSWVRSAVNKAVEGGPTNLRRAVRTYTDSVVLHASNAVVGGAKIIHDRIASRNMQSFRHTAKRLEELSVSCRGIERVQLLRRWLVALKEVERLTATCTDTNAKYSEQDNQFLYDELKDSPIQEPTLIYYVDPGVQGEPKNFRDVFLSSQAFEGITLSMKLSFIFADLWNLTAGYLFCVTQILDAPNEEEVSLLSEIYGLCIKGGKEEHTALLSSVQDLAKAFSGYQDEVLAKREELLQYVQSAMSGLKVNADLMRLMQNALDEAMVKIQTCSKLEELLLRKKYFSFGDSPQLHSEKVDKLKILSESLANSTTKAENRISENRCQEQLLRELAKEIRELEEQRNDLEERLRKVNALLTSARVRLHNAKEEREQFDEASNDIVSLLKTKEDEMVRAITSYTVEANLVGKWIKFLESTWVFQTSHTKRKEEQVKLAISSAVDIEGSKVANPRKKLEAEYLDIESKFFATLNIVDTIKEQFHIQKEGIFRKDIDKVTELFYAIEKIKEEFESIERPKLEIEMPTERSETPPSQVTSRTPASPSMVNKYKQDGVIDSPSITARSQIEIELDKLSDESAEEISEWEFDALDKDRLSRS